MTDNHTDKAIKAFSKNIQHILTLFKRCILSKLFKHLKPHYMNSTINLGINAGFCLPLSGLIQLYLYDLSLLNRKFTIIFVAWASLTSNHTH